jgi:deazaflavin-dependent oxidoreductase (nitroreductase family)
MMKTTAPRARQSGANAWVAWLLRSPLRALLDHSTMLITVTGRKTGTAYTIPVTYVPDQDALIVLSKSDRIWWRNARCGAQVGVHVRGRDFYGQAETIEEPAAVAAAIEDLIRRVPAFRKSFYVQLGRDGSPTNPERVAWLIHDRVIVRITGLHPA